MWMAVLTFFVAFDELVGVRILSCFLSLAFQPFAFLFLLGFRLRTSTALFTYFHGLLALAAAVVLMRASGTFHGPAGRVDLGAATGVVVDVLTGVFTVKRA